MAARLQMHDAEEESAMPIVREEGRRLATVERITGFEPIPDADAIVQARVRGWTVVVKRPSDGLCDVAWRDELDGTRSRARCG